MIFLSANDEIFRQQLSMVICVAVMIVITTLYIIANVSKDDTKKYEKILNPTHKIGQAPKAEMQKNKKRYKKEKIPFVAKIKIALSKKGWDKKINSWYLQAGYKNKQAEDLVIATIKCLLVAIILACLLFILLENILIAMVSIILVFFPIINLFSEISERKRAFNKDFPYFLQTLSFVLKNGANMSIAFEDVVNKQQESVLKQVMLDVITTSKIEGGNFVKAFSTIPQQIDTEETREFIDIVQNQLEKGASVSDVFMQQSELMSERFELRQSKLIASSSTKIFLPILLIMVSIIILFVSL